MMKKVLVSAFAGAVILLLWSFVLNVVLGFNARLNMKQIPNEREVYALLKTSITEPGRYLCNPALTPDGRFPDNEPVFGIQYAGVGHEAAGLGAVLDLLQFLIVPLIGAWMLSTTSDVFRSRFINRVGFFVVLGLLEAVTNDLNSYGIGASPLQAALLFALALLLRGHWSAW